MTLDIRTYFQKVEETEQMIGAPHVVIVSQATPDGGKAGVASEVGRTVAAELIAQGRARLATEAEAREYRASQERARAAAEQERLANRVQVAVMSEQDLRTLKGSHRPQRS
jgi:hypothetical protein